MQLIRSRGDVKACEVSARAPRAALCCRGRLAERWPAVLCRSRWTSCRRASALQLQPQHTGASFGAADGSPAQGERPLTPPCHQRRRLCAGQPAASRRPLQRVRCVAGPRPFSLQTAWARPSSLWPRYAATPSPASHPVASALRGAATCCRWPTREAAMLISAAAASNQRREPLAGCLGTAQAAGISMASGKSRFEAHARIE